MDPDKTVHIGNPDIPTRAPALYAKRPDKSQNPIEFLRKHYGKFVDKTHPKFKKTEFCQATIRRIDPKLYMGLHNWFRRYGIPDWLHLPKLEVSNDFLISKLSEAMKNAGTQIVLFVPKRTSLQGMSKAARRRDISL